MRALVVGGAGYLGGLVVDLAREAGHDVLVYDSLLYTDAYLKPVPFEYGDVRDTSRLRTHLDWAEVVFWLAGIVGDGACALDPLTATEVNDEAVGWLAGCYDGRVIFTSTCSVYGVQDGLLTETSPVGPLSLYAASKLRAEGHLSNRNAVVLRLGTLYGYGGRPRLDLVVNTLTARAVLDRQLRVFGGNQYRPLLHVRDAARTIVTALDVPTVGTFNLAGENTQILTVARQVQEVVPGTYLDIVDTTVEDARNYQASTVKARQRLGFAPTRTVQDGIHEIKTLVESGRLRDPRSPRWTNHGFLVGGQRAS